MPKDELAKKRWLAIPSELRKKLESNVFCVNCGETTITNYEVDSEDHYIILRGYCQSCNGKVARVID